MQASKAAQALASNDHLTPYEAASYESGGQRFDKIVRFATVDCVEAGWLVKEKCIRSITDEGRKAHAELTDPRGNLQASMQIVFGRACSAAGC